jgi:hypothetical protein
MLGISCQPVQLITSREELSSNEILVDVHSLSYVGDLMIGCTEDKMLVSLHSHSCEPLWSEIDRSAYVRYTRRTSVRCWFRDLNQTRIW